MLEVGGVRLDECFLVFGHILEGMNRIGTAGRNTRATVDAAFWVDVHLSRGFETGLVLLGWMQSVGQTSTHRESLMQESVIT